MDENVTHPIPYPESSPTPSHTQFAKCELLSFSDDNPTSGCRVRVGQMCQDRESGISVILLMVDHKVVDILVVNVILDMDELTVIGLSVIGTLAGLSYPTRSWSWARLHTARDMFWIRKL